MTERDPEQFDVPLGDLPPEDLPLDELRRAWSEIGAPRPDAELAQCDEPTRAAVVWMQSAWSSVEVPAPVLPRRALTFSRRQYSLSHKQRLIVPLAAAAGALLALGAWLALQRFAPGVRPSAVSPAIAHDTTAAEQSPLSAGTTYLATGVEVASLAPDRLEACSGSVCLILLTPRSSPETP